MQIPIAANSGYLLMLNLIYMLNAEKHQVGNLQQVFCLSISTNPKYPWLYYLCFSFFAREKSSRTKSAGGGFSPGGYPAAGGFIKGRYCFIS